MFPLPFHAQRMISYRGKACLAYVYRRAVLHSFSVHHAEIPIDTVRMLFGVLGGVITSLPFRCWYDLLTDNVRISKSISPFQGEQFTNTQICVIQSEEPGIGWRLVRLSNQAILPFTNVYRGIFNLWLKNLHLWHIIYLTREPIASVHLAPGEICITK